MNRRAWLIAGLAGCLIQGATAEVRLARIFTDDMILQRGPEVQVWGWADPGEQVTVTFAGQTRLTTAGQNGAWGVKLSDLAASATGRELSAKGSNTITVANVLVGDVWLCSGQSNMEWTLGGCNAPEDIQTGKLPLIWWFRVPLTCAESPLADMRSDQPLLWRVCDPGNPAGISAVGFYFARKVHHETGVPIGVLVSSVGGTNIEKWTPREAFAHEPELADMNRQIEAAIGEYRADLKQQLPLVEQWLLQTKAAQAANAPIPPQPALPLPPSMPGSKAGGHWLHLYNGMIHPKNKQDVGERLARWALAKDYGNKDLVFSGPLYREMKVEGDKIRIGFDSAGSGLTAATKTGRAPILAESQGKLRGFAIAGEDQQWVWADATIDGTTVLVSSPKVSEPVAVHYAFTMNPATANLYNKDGLPA